MRVCVCTACIFITQREHVFASIIVCSTRDDNNDDGYAGDDDKKYGNKNKVERTRTEREEK